MQWKNREIDWYNAERRFIFASKSLKTNEKVMLIVTKQKLMEALAKKFHVKPTKERKLSES